MTEYIKTISREVFGLFLTLDKRFSSIPKTCEYILSEFISDLSANINFSKSNPSSIEYFNELELPINTSLNSSLIQIHTSETVNIIIKSILATKKPDEIASIVAKLQFKFLNTSVFTPKFHKNPFSILAKKRIYIGSIGSSRIDKIILFLSFFRKLRRISLKEVNLTNSINIDRKELIKKILLLDEDIEKQQIMSLVILLAPSILIEHVQFLFDYDTHNYVPITKRDIIISSNIFQYCEILIALREKYQYYNIILQHGIGYKEIKGDIRFSLEQLISDKWISWDSNLIPNPKIKVLRSSNPFYTTLIYPRHHKFQGRDIMSLKIEELEATDDLFIKSINEIKSMKDRKLNIRMLTDSGWHTPLIDIINDTHTNNCSFEKVIDKSSVIICISYSTALIESILSEVPTIWLCPSQFEALLQGYLLDLHRYMKERNTVLSENSNIMKLRLLLNPKNQEQLKMSHQENRNFLKSKLNIYKTNKFIRGLKAQSNSHIYQ
tara:strand:- start:27720 stop:29201 length:1482 start_codon:yes stop_codon:yes gene_type:complete